MGRSWLFALLLVGCAGKVEQDDFARATARELCPAYRQCAQGLYEYYFDADYQDCLDDVEEVVQVYVEFADDLACDFDPEEAADCLAEVRQMDCQDLHDEGMIPDLGTGFGETLLVSVGPCTKLLSEDCFR
jgi:hypothetical protein